MAIIVGLEGVLARHEWRQPLIESDGWEHYHRMGEKDAPNGPVVQLINAMHSRGQIIWCVTTRPAQWFGMTQQWLVRHGCKVDELLMRPQGSWEPELELRKRWIEHVNSDAGVLFAIEESEKACEAYRAAGITVLQVNNPNGERQ